MFEIDIKRIEACIYYKDYFSALEYSILIKDNYKNEQREYIENIIKNIKSGNYKIF